MNEPYLQSERHFRRYEPYIEEIVRQWPLPCIFTPKPPVCSIETLASRLRICIKALDSNIASGDRMWDVGFPVNKFVQISDEITVSTTAMPGKVVVGPMKSIRKLTPLGVQVEPEITQVIPKVHLVEPSDELIKAVIVLHHHRLLTEPSVIQVTARNMNWEAEGYDVAIEKNGDTYTII